MSSSKSTYRFDRLRRAPRRKAFPAGTVIFYGPTNLLATKVTVGVVLKEYEDPAFLERWFDDTGDIRNNESVMKAALAFLESHGVNQVIVADRIFGCPHEEGTDYPVGDSCPACPYWAGRNRVTHEREH